MTSPLRSASRWSRLASGILALALTGWGQESIDIGSQQTKNVTRGVLKAYSVGYIGPVAEFYPTGDFILYNDEGKETLRLKRGVRGDAIHEQLATLLMRAVTGNWDLKDWRDAK